MRVIEDTRKVVQDVLAPELRAISVRLDSLEKLVDLQDPRAEKRHGEVMKKIDTVTDAAGSASEWPGLRKDSAPISERIHCPWPWPSTAVHRWV